MACRVCSSCLPSIPIDRALPNLNQNKFCKGFVRANLPRWMDAEPGPGPKPDTAPAALIANPNMLQSH